MAIGPSAYCACLTEFLLRTPLIPSLSLDIQLSKTGGQTARHFNRQTAGQALWSVFLSLLPENVISLDQASLLKLSFGSLAGWSAFLHGNLPLSRPVIGSYNH